MAASPSSRAPAARAALLCILVGAGCGSSATPAGSELLRADVESDLSAELRSGMQGSLRQPAARVAFPDGEASVDVEIIAARGPEPQGAPRFLRTIRVKVVDAGGYELSASLVGGPQNAGTVEAPVQTRLLRVTRRKVGLLGTSLGQMSVRVTPTGAERI